MKLRKIEEIATKQVPIWQPALLIALLLLGYFAVPLIARKTSMPVKKNQSLGSILGISAIKERLNNDVGTLAKPLSDGLKKEVGMVLGLAQQTVQNIASQSANQAKEFIFDNTVGKVLQNINTLSTDQQELIKKAICK